METHNLLHIRAYKAQRAWGAIAGLGTPEKDCDDYGQVIYKTMVVPEQQLLIQY